MKRLITQKTPDHGQGCQRGQGRRHCHYGGVDIYIHRQQLEIGHGPAIWSLTKAGRWIYSSRSMTRTKSAFAFQESRRALLANEQQGQGGMRLWNSIEVGKEYAVFVRSLTDFGAFVDNGGVDGLVHVSELFLEPYPSSVRSRQRRRSDFMFLSKIFDPGKKRISLGYKGYR